MTGFRGGGRPPAYRTTDGQRVPGVTTILSRFKESGGLIGWAHKMGLEGKSMDETRDNAASAGTVAHAMMDNALHGEPRDKDLPSAGELRMTDEQYDEACGLARVSFGAFETWRKAVALEVVATEVPLVSDEHRFGGTLDAVVLVSGQRAILDFKTGNALYSEHLVQCAAYRHLWDAARPDEPIEALHLLRVDKVFASFHHHSWPLEVLDMGWRQFLNFRAAYDIDAKLKKAVG